MQIPLFLGIALGSLGLVVGQGLGNDGDFGSSTDRQQIQIMAPVMGFVIGFLPAYLVLPDKRVEHVVSCAG